MERALSAVQLLLEPAGVAARTTKESLLLQIDAREAAQEEAFGARDAAPVDWSLPRAIVEHHLDDLAQNRLPKVAQKLGKGVDKSGAKDYLDQFAKARGLTRGQSQDFKDTFNLYEDKGLAPLFERFKKVADAAGLLPK